MVVAVAIGLGACRSGHPPAAAAILLFDGAGSSRDDVAAVAAILDDEHLDYATVDSAQLNDMSAAQLAAHRLLIVPGGNFITMGEHLEQGTLVNIHDAVHGGLGYLGICAGAFLAAAGRYNSLNLTSGARFGFYSAEARGVRKAAVAITGAATPPLDQYWEDGPQLSGWGAIVGKYPDGTPAIVEGSAGRGWVILSGVHPEAPASWRSGMRFATPVSVDRDFAAQLIDAALNRRWLAHF
jgi:glutamine amidotransferase-like uncharacterized protein